ncbi:MAG: hypothetical protein Q4B42_06050, partial [Oscillospiraceae bacterium]|nr:hypothetical protein [Oscillospiraceae bacterium]
EELTLSFGEEGSFVSFTVLEGENDYLVRISSMGEWVRQELESLALSCENGGLVINSFAVLEAD